MLVLNCQYTSYLILNGDQLRQHEIESEGAKVNNVICGEIVGTSLVFTR